jgi:hypothetical protein
MLRSVNERKGYTDQLGVFSPLLNSASTQSNLWLNQISGWMMTATPNGHTAQDEYEELTDVFLKILGMSSK